MSHLYPIARTARDALTQAEPAALTKSEAQRLCTVKDHHIKSLETEWLTLTPAELADFGTRADKGVDAGFVQRYENAQGATVLAVSYWKLHPDTEHVETKPATPEPVDPAKPELDHTDDLYFRGGRTKKRRRQKKPDPNQLDLFGTPPENE